VILLDAYALIAFLVAGPGAAQVRVLLRTGEAAVTTANLAETLDVSQRIYGLPVSRADAVLGPLFDGWLAAVDLDRSISRRAAEIRATYYHRSTRPISLADAVLIASAKDGDQIATADPHVLEVAQAESIEPIVLRARR
jgi:predicted nucleic acid-binding protein